MRQLGARVWIAPTAIVLGDIEVGDDVSFWFGSVARGDVHQIRVGARTNVQDGAVLHVTHERFALTIGAEVSIGHQATVHGATLGDGVLVGIGARVLDGAVVEAEAQVAAGAVVVPGQIVPSGHLAMGIPAKIVRRLTPDEITANRAVADRYVELKEIYRAQLVSENLR